MWDTLMTRWAGEGMTGYRRWPNTCLEKKTWEKKRGGTSIKKTRDLDPVVIEPPTMPDGTGVIARWWSIGSMARRSQNTTTDVRADFRKS